MTHEELNQLVAFNAAKKLAFELPIGTMRRAKVNNNPVNYWGVHIKDQDGNEAYYVAADNAEELKNPDALLNGRHAREVFDGFVIMSK